MEQQPREGRGMHALPSAPQFVGREAELVELRGIWEGGLREIVALVGLGGAGKTALAARFLSELKEPWSRPRPETVFVWSFYLEPDAGLFLQEAHRHFAGEGQATPAKGAGLVHVLAEALGAGGLKLLVLDGLERVQRQDGHDYGTIEDPLLKGLLCRLAEGIATTTVLVTSRFPLTDLEPQRGKGYRHLDVGGLDVPSAIALLRSRGVKGEDAELAKLVEAYGAHALTLDHLGGLVGQFLGGDPSRAPEAPAMASPTVDRQALRLARLLVAYEDHLPKVELALLSRLCLLHRGATLAQIERLFLCTPPVQARTAGDLARQVQDLKLPKNQPTELRLDLANAIGQMILEQLADNSLAGPDSEFRQDVFRALWEVPREHEGTAEEDVENLIALYGNRHLSAQPDKCPLPLDDRPRLARLAIRYRHLRDHPFSRDSEQDQAILKVLAALSGLQRKPEWLDDLDAIEIGRALRNVRWRLHQLAIKHHVLVRVSELCRLRRRKWELAGPMATLDAAGLKQAMEGLMARHLVIREGPETYSVHPAVRDHFTRRSAAEHGDWHDLIRDQLVSLIGRPGVHLPEDRATLDLLEEAIFHAIQAKRPDEAQRLYERGLGGHRHLCWKLGEMARGLRILRGFELCPDDTGLAWYLRALGEFDEAHSRHRLAYFRADIRLLQGRLPEVAREGDSIRAEIAAFLMGQTTKLPPDIVGAAVPRVQHLLYQGRVRDAANMPRHGAFYHVVGWEGDRARHELLMAEVARRQADLAGCRELLDRASTWLLHAGSVEHLCLWHLVRARAANDDGAVRDAERAVSEGVHLAGRCGLWLYQVELLNARAEVALAAGDAATAEMAAREALGLAAAEACRFAWGVAEAGHWLGRSLAVQWRFGEARAAFEESLVLRERLGDPRAEQTERLLARLPR